jgi:heptosyltransferase-2
VKPARRILVVGPSWVGDMVMAQSLFMLLRRHHPDARLDVLAPAWSRPLLERMPQVDGAIDLPFRHGELGLRKRLRLGRELAGKGYDQAILLPNSLKSALPIWRAGIPQRSGWLGEMRYGLLNDWRRLDKQRLPMTVQRFAALAYPAGFDGLPDTPAPRLEVKVINIQQALQDLGLSKGTRKTLAFCPGAEYGPAKRWPVSHYGELANGFLHQGLDVWLFGSDKDRQVCEAINALSGQRCSNLAGRTSLAQAVDLMSLADAVVSNDSGLMHVAAALARPLLALYGSSDPGFTPPLSQRARIISLGLDCSPCFKRECPLGHLDCLQQISVARVVNDMKALGI